MVMAGNNQYKVSEFIKEIPGTGGIISTIAARVGCAWNTAKKYIEEHPTVQQAYKDECERVDDAAESVVMEAIKNKDVGTSKWWLSRKRRETFGDALRLNLDFTKLTDSQLERIARGEDVIHVLTNPGAS